MARKQQDPPPPNGEGAGPEDTGLGAPALPDIPSISGAIPDPEPSADAPTNIGGEGEETQAPKRRRRSRKPRQQEEPAAAPAGPSPEEVAALSSALGATFGVGFDMIARKRGEHWRLAGDDKADLGNLWGTALAPYLGVAAKYAPIFAAAFKTWERIDARLQLDAMRPVSIPISGGEVRTH